MEEIVPRRHAVTWFRVSDRADDASARRAAMLLSDRLGFGEVRRNEVGIVAAELTSNVVRHGGGGVVGLIRLANRQHAGVGLLAIDSGPGIADLATSSADGHSTRGTLGIGLGAVGRLATTVDVYSTPRKGTTVWAQLWEVTGGNQTGRVAGLVRPMTNEEVSGDLCTDIRTGTRRTLFLADGLGHGPMAAAASIEAARVLEEDPSLAPAAALQAVHRRIRHTRGVAAAVTSHEEGSGVIRFAGIGNIAAWIVSHEGRRGMSSQPGIVGHQVKHTIREETYELPPDAAVVLHSDGLTDRWNIATYPGLTTRPAMVIAAVLLRDAGIRHDDASILVARYGP